METIKREENGLMTNDLVFAKVKPNAIIPSKEDLLISTNLDMYLSMSIPTLSCLSIRRSNKIPKKNHVTVLFFFSTLYSTSLVPSATAPITFPP